ncbi:MAG: hypothetical protein QM679_05245 [Patulibacter sp.]
MKPSDIEVRSVTIADLELLASFRCATTAPWETTVEQQIRGPLPLRYLGSPQRFDGRMLLGLDRNGALLVVGAHHIEPTMTPDVGYTEVIAVANDARGTLIELPDGRDITLGAFMLLTIFKQMRKLGRHPRTFARIDRRNTRSLALCDRLGLHDEYPDPHDPTLVQRWGELPEK